MKILVVKFGGSVLTGAHRFLEVANFIEKKKQSWDQIIIVVSAIQGVTDYLIDVAGKITQKPPKREMDMLVSVGERVSCSLLAMALHEKGLEAISLTGSQAGIITSSDHFDAKIIEVKPTRIESSFSQNKIVIVAGFQGVSKEKEITTLGRGGSDTTAVALAIALEAKQVEFIKDVEGIYEADPKKEKRAKLFSSLSYEKALQVVENGAKVLHPRAIHLAEKNRIDLYVCSLKNSTDNVSGTHIRSENESQKTTLPIYEN